MKRVLIPLFAALTLAAVALASPLPQTGTVVVTDGTGVQVGTGTIVDGTLQLTLDPGTTGLVTLTVTGPKGETETYKAMIDTKGQATLVQDDGPKAGGDDGIHVGTPVGDDSPTDKKDDPHDGHDD